MTNHDYMLLLTRWVHADRDPAFVAVPLVNELPATAGSPALRCCFSDDTPHHLQLWFVLRDVDTHCVDHLVDLLEANDQIDPQADGLGFFACLSEGSKDRFAWVVRMPFTPASTVNDLRTAVARGSAHAAARWLAALPEDAAMPPVPAVLIHPVAQPAVPPVATAETGQRTQALCTLINAVLAANGQPGLRAHAAQPPMPDSSHHLPDTDWAGRLREKNHNTVQVGPHAVHLGHCAERVPDHLMVHVPIGICFDDAGLMLNLLRFNETTQAEAMGMGHFSVGRSADGEDAVLMYRGYLRVTAATTPDEVLSLLRRIAPFAYASANECLSEVAELDAVDDDLGPHGPVRPGHGGLGALGDFDQVEPTATAHGRASDHQAEPGSDHESPRASQAGSQSGSDHESRDEPGHSSASASDHHSQTVGDADTMSEDSSSEQVLETPPPSPRPH